MKKIVFTLLIMITSSVVFTSCTEEEIKPRNTELAGGGQPADPL